MGLSDRPPEVNVDRWVEDVTVVLDTVGSERADVFGVAAGGLIAIPFAATYPARVRALVLYGSFARQMRAGQDYPIGHRPEDVDAHIAYTEPRWGSGVGLRLFCPSASDDPVAREQFGRFQRASASPGAAAAYLRTVAQIDVRRALPMVEAPTLVLHARRDRVIPIELAHYLAERMPHATLAEVDSADHLIWFSDAVDAVADQIQDFLVGVVPNLEIRRVLATVVFIVGLHPRPRPLAGAGAYAETRAFIGRFRGRTVRHDAGGILATFDGPARAIRCASELVAHLWPTELSVRVGVHSGECDATSTGVSGVAVDIARGVADLARPGEVLVSQTVRDLVLGSSITFRDPCSHQLRDVPGRWRVYAVAGT
jgi:pimeloyl-ACP methyl ester carboxylesterase